VTQAWRTALVTSSEENIWIRGYDIASLMRRGSFVDTVFLLHRGRLPHPHEAKLLDAILVASADHGSGAPSCATARLAASGNRQSLSAAIAAGILAIGDEHGGAGSLCMEMIGRGAALASQEGITIEESAAREVALAKAAKRRLPGLGHRVHTKDPRVEVLFEMAREGGGGVDGVRFMQSLEAAAATAIKPLPMNIDGALAAVLYDLGFPPSAGKLIFIVGRVAGLTAEVAEEYAREKPMRIRIPVKYDGVPPREMD
jgi:citrate synthase